MKQNVIISIMHRCDISAVTPQCVVVNYCWKLGDTNTGAVGVVASMLAFHAGDRGSSHGHSTNSES